MKQLILGVLLVLLVSCVKDTDIFTPNETSGPISQLKNIIATQSFQRKLDASLEYSLNTDRNTLIHVPKQVIENNPSGYYDINFIELNSNRDLLLHNVEHHSEKGAINMIYSFYISFDSENLLELIDENKYIEVKFPSSKINDEIIVGRGIIEEETLNWYYDNNELNSSLSYENWQVNASDGSLRNETGYSLRVNKAGWYSVVSLPKDNFIYDDICLILPTDFKASNTSSFLISGDLNYITNVKPNNSENNIICSNNVPFLAQSSYTIVSISYIDDQFYFYKSLAHLGDPPHNIQLEPIDEYVLINELQNL